MRAIEPNGSGRLHTHGFSIGYETFGDPANPAVLLLPPWQIVHSRIWKMQVPYLARSYRVITFDPPGNGSSERTAEPAAFEFERVSRQGIAILDHLDIDRSSVVGFSRSCAYALWLAATFPERIEGVVLLANGVSREGWTRPPGPEFFQPRETYTGWEKQNAHYWRQHYDDWLEFFFTELNPEPHSTRPIDDGVAWGHETTVDILIASLTAPGLAPSLSVRDALARIECPVLIIHGTDDRRLPIAASYDLIAARPDWELVVMEGCGHGLPGRHPVAVNQLIGDFLRQRAMSDWEIPRARM